MGFFTAATSPVYTSVRCAQDSACAIRPCSARTLCLFLSLSLPLLRLLCIHVDCCLLADLCGGATYFLYCTFPQFAVTQNSFVQTTCSSFAWCLFTKKIVAIAQSRAFPFSIQQKVFCPIPGSLITTALHDNFGGWCISVLGLTYMCI